MRAGRVYVPSPSVAVPVRFAACFAAWRKARRGKRPSANQLAFEARWLDRLLELKTALCAGDWQPARTVSFVVSHPKTREIHAPDFADRVVHHLLVERLEKLYEPIFIHDSYANRKGKGSHAAVDRLQGFMQSRNGQGWYLQLDIHNYFNGIDRRVLYRMLCHRLTQCEQRGALPAAHALALRSLCHKLLANKVAEWVSDPSAAAKVPPHKRLANAAPHCGLPVGNLTSQFFANVYLNALDQFVKHTLKCRHYVRYVDDFVLLADDAAQLRLWQVQIADFLAATLALRCKDAAVLQPLCQGVDFLGYRVFAGHRRVRPRVLAHCRSKLQDWAARHVYQTPQGVWLRADSPDRGPGGPDALAHLQALLGSYWGHFAHAQSVRLRHAIFEQFAWLKSLFVLHRDGQIGPRWLLQGVCFTDQASELKETWREAHCLIQQGNRWRSMAQPGLELDRVATQRLQASLRRQGVAYVRADQTGWLRHGARRREVREWFYPAARTSIVMPF